MKSIRDMSATAKVSETSVSSASTLWRPDHRRENVFMDALQGRLETVDSEGQKIEVSAQAFHPAAQRFDAALEMQFGAETQRFGRFPCIRLRPPAD